MDDFRQGHISGAAWVAREVTVTNVDGVGGMLPDPEFVAMDLEEAGVRHNTPIVVYDSGNGLWASRLFWALEYLGHEQVHLLDGGLPAWNSAGYELSTEIAAPARGEFEPRVREHLIADEAFVLENHGNQDFTVLDARSPDEFSGADVRAARGGHIPNATNIDWVRNRGDNGRSFLSVAELSEVYEQTLDGRNGPRVTLCQTGIRGAHTYVALRILGEEDVRLYDGSWAEWGNNADAPIAVGSTP
ncbi:MAG: sulfurtransferase [Spirochaeta sp.]|nr:sulfurtransferase [Spirochaeta sp.]